MNQAIFYANRVNKWVLLLFVPFPPKKFFLYSFIPSHINEFGGLDYAEYEFDILFALFCIYHNFAKISEAPITN
jgi:hypothetical protein